MDELRKYWAPHLDMIKELQPFNPDDPYYNWDTKQRDVDNGVTRIHKNLYLHWIGANIAPLHVLEIGTRTGLSLASMLSSHPRPQDACVVSVDPYYEDGSPDKNRKNIELLDRLPKQLDFIVGLSEKIVPDIAKRGIKFDYILVDGSHEPKDALVDLRLGWPLLIPGGVLVFDDLHMLPEVWNEWTASIDDGVHISYTEPYEFGVAVRKTEA